MADELKRVGLVFKEDGAVDFKKSLQEVNLELNKNYNQFKLVQTQWDNSIKSSEKLKTEQEYLANAYAIQGDKVSTLKMQLADLENAEEKNITAIKKKRNEIVNAEIKLETYKSKLKDVENQLHNTGKKVEEFGTKVENVGKKIESAGKKVSAFSFATGTALVASAKTAIDFEDAFAGVEKTVDGTAEQMEELKQGIRDMAKEIPSSTTEISAVAEAAGQLGIKTEDILDFTKVMIDLGNSTNLSAEEAASSLAKFANITNMSAKDYSKLGSTVVALGNNFATTEADIVAMSTRLAATGDLAGLSQPQILSLATAMSSVGIEAEAGGSAMSKLLKKIQLATELGGEDLKQFAKVSGMTATEFKQAFEKDAVGALSSFIGGLNDTERNGKSAIAILDDMGLTEVRLSNTILSLANSSEVMTKAVQLGSDAWEDNSALTNEANRRYDTLKSKITIAVNKIKDQAITIGNKLMPAVQKILDGFDKWIKKFENLSEEQIDMILKISLAVTAMGPLITIFGKATSAIGLTVKGIGTFVQAIGVVGGTVTSTSKSVNGLASIIQGIISPTGLAVTAIIALSAALIYLATQESDAQKRAKELSEEMQKDKEALEDFNKKIDETTKANISQIDSVSTLKNELKELVDENGKVKEGYESRVSFILNELNKALGTEYTLNNNIIDSYKNLQDEIDKLIAKKRAEILLKSYEEKYTNAIINETEAVEKLKSVHEELGMSLEDAKEKYDKLVDKMTEFERSGNIYNSEYFNTGKEKLALKDLITAYEDATKTVKEYTENKEEYEDNYALYVEEKYEEIGKTIKDNTQKWSDDSIKNVKESIEKQEEALEIYKKIYKETGNEIAQQNQEQAKANIQQLATELNQRTNTISIIGVEEIRAWKTLARTSFEEYKTEISKMPIEMQTKIQEITGVIVNNVSLNESVSNKSEEMTNTFTNRFKFSETVENKITSAANFIKNDTQVQSEMGNLASRAESRIRQNNSSAWGEDMVEGLGNGIKSKGNSSWFTNILSNLAGRVASFLHFSRPDEGPLREYEKWMPDMVEGLSKSLDKSSPKLINSVKNMSEGMAEELKTVEVNNFSQKNLNTSNSNVDYDKMANAFLTALNKCKLTVDEEGFAKIIKNELYEVL